MRVGARVLKVIDEASTELVLLASMLEGSHLLLREVWNTVSVVLELGLRLGRTYPLEARIDAFGPTKTSEQGVVAR